ncbi:hypothetical protein MSAS_34460 [Mycobacterium saskatchewanense]|nr:hypothetical protein MSAS_34460 [Mycobacterium saskatchewanense]
MAQLVEPQPVGAGELKHRRVPVVGSQPFRADAAISDTWSSSARSKKSCSSRLVNARLVGDYSVSARQFQLCGESSHVAGHDEWFMECVVNVVHAVPANATAGSAPNMDRETVAVHVQLLQIAQVDDYPLIAYGPSCRIVSVTED